MDIGGNDEKVVIILILLSISYNLVSCSNSELEELKNVNYELQEEVNRLQDENNSLMQQLSVKEDNKESHDKNIDKKLNETKYLFDPYSIDIGEKVLGLEILNIKIERTPINTSLYTFMVDEEDIKKIPKLFDTSKMFIDISNEEEITKLFGKKLSNEEDKVYVKAKFNNFKYVHVPNTDWSSEFNLVEVIEIYD